MMDVAAPIALGFFWLASCALKLRRFTDFREDMRAMVSTDSRILAGALVMVEGVLGLTLTLNLTNRVAGCLSLALLLAFTVSFLIRAVRTSSLTCACFGLRLHTRHRPSHDLRLASVIRDCLRPATLAARNAAFVSLAAAVAKDTAYLSELAGFVFVTMFAATVTSIVTARNDVSRVPHPRLPELLQRRRKVFATVWHAGLWSPWMVCLSSSGTELVCSRNLASKGR
ncbi:MAG: MauE/DoxX family redox-associated membrane protein [Pseudonocardiaceae bacterium]